MVRELTVAQLEKILQRKKARLDSLLHERSRLQKKLAQVEERIMEIGGVAREERALRRPRRRPKNEKTLIAAVTDVLSQAKKGLTLKELASKLLESGYKTTSTNFQNTLYQCLYHNAEQLTHDPKTHTYRLK